MRPTLILPAVVLGLAVAAGPAQPPAGDAKPPAADARKDIDRFQGAWRVTKFEKEGLGETDEKLKSMTVVFAGDKMTVRTGGKNDVAQFTLDPAKKPAEIDIRPQAGAKAVVLRGIYEFEAATAEAPPAGGDAKPAAGEPRDVTLRICFTLDGKDQRPKEVKSSLEDRTAVMILERRP
jgi:uncharacterized protein (TIGR03067 family)